MTDPREESLDELRRRTEDVLAKLKDGAPRLASLCGAIMDRFFKPEGQ